MMRFYDRQHKWYAGIDLHARTLHLGGSSLSSLGQLDTGHAGVAWARRESPQLSGRGKRPGGFDPEEWLGAASRLTPLAKVAARQTSVRASVGVGTISKRTSVFCGDLLSL